MSSGGRVHEEEVNIRIAELLSEELGLNCRPERPSDRSDIRCYYRGFNIVIELWLKEGDRYRADLSVSELKELIRGSRFDAALFTPSPQPELVKFITERSTARLSVGWFIDVNPSFIRVLITSSIEYLIEEGVVEGVIEEVNRGLVNFITALENQPQNTWQRIYDILYRLYGLQLTEARDAEVVYGQAGLSILLSSTFYEHVRALHGLDSLNAYVNR